MSKPTGKHPQKRLNVRQVQSLTAPGRYADGNGLYLEIEPSGSKRWTMRVMVQGRRRDIGLGGVNTVTLADARMACTAIHNDIRSGLDPVAERRNTRRVLPTFAEAAALVHEQLKPTWKNPKHADQWINTLKNYVYPSLGPLKIDTIDTPKILATLMPIWLEKPETARRVKQRLHAVFDWAKAAGHRSGDNPVDGVARGLPKQTDQDDHHEALPYDEVNEFVTKLRCGPSGMSAKLGFEFLILTATRTGDVIGAKWAEIDLNSACWTIPADRIKSKKEHRVPLSPRCLEILGEAATLGGDFVFPGRSSDRPLSNMAFLKIIERMGLNITAHGFRSTFRDWTADQTNYPNEVCEQALAHAISSRVEAAYRRTDLYDRRKNLMADWSTYVAMPQPKRSTGGTRLNADTSQKTPDSDQKRLPQLEEAKPAQLSRAKAAMLPGIAAAKKLAENAAPSGKLADLMDYLPKKR